MSIFHPPSDIASRPIDTRHTKGVEVTPVVDHEWAKSIYFNDPNGIMLEYCCYVRGLGEDDAEDLVAQMRCVAVFSVRDPGDMTHWARLHLDIIARFGRFPHRNAILGRTSTPEDLAFLAAGGFRG